MRIGRPEFTFFILGNSTTIQLRPSTSATLSRAQEKRKLSFNQPWTVGCPGALFPDRVPIFPAKTTIFNLPQFLNLLAQSRDASKLSMTNL
jgi:hypothetical protein